MEITKQQILERKALAENSRDKAHSEYFQSIGIINDCNHWLKIIDTPVVEDEPTETDTQ
jgi:hypothetical protein